MCAVRPGAGGHHLSDDWDSARYQREKRNFIESRLRFRSVYLHTVLIFTMTWLAGWLFSWALLKFGLNSMPLRYGIGFLLSYFVFIACAIPFPFQSDRSLHLLAVNKAPTAQRDCAVNRLGAMHGYRHNRGGASGGLAWALYEKNRRQAQTA